MCTTMGAVERTLDQLSDLTSVDVSLLPDRQVRDELLSLMRAAHQVRAAVLARVAAFDARGLAHDDGFRTTTGWLGGFAHVGRYAAGGMVKTARVLRELPAVAAACGRGEVSEDHVGKVVKLADDVGVVAVKDFDAILADLAAAALPAQVGVACDRIRAYVDPDGPEPDPAAEFERRGVHLTPTEGGVLLKGRLDLEAGAALMTALDALMRPPTGGDPRTAVQRRADALADLARGALASGGLPTVGGVRPQIGILIPAETLLGSGRLVELPKPATPPHAPAASEAAEWSKPATPPEAPAAASEAVELSKAATPSEAVGGTGDPAALPKPATPSEAPGAPAESAKTATASGDPLTAAGVPPLPEPGWMDWNGAIPTELARRLACDGSVWRIVLDPVNGLPLELGRAYRTAPHWLRKALHARDRGCRWPGCTVPSQWTDSHHWRHWIDGGLTNIDEMLSLCRFHHVQAHEGGWTVHLDQSTGEVGIARPDGQPYELAPSQPHLGATTQRAVGDRKVLCGSP